MLSTNDISQLVALLEQGHPERAELGARAALNAHPDAGILWKILSVARVRQGKDALSALRRAAELLPGDLEALRNLGSALHDQQQWAEAFEALRQVVAHQPNDVEALVDTGNALRGLGRARDAVALYERALALKPSMVEARNNLGNAHLELGELEQALTCYRQALEQKPLDPQIIANLSSAHRQSGQYEDAVAYARQSVALEPGSAAAHNNLGLALALLKRREEALASYKRALDLNPKSVDALNNLGNLLRETGDRAGALTVLRQAIELDPTRAESHSNLGNVLFELRQIDQALACQQQALALKPDHAPAHLSLAFALRQKRKHAEAEASCRAALELNPRYVEAHSFLGELHADAGRFAEAEKCFRQALEIDPAFPFALASIATHRKMTREDTKWLRTTEGLLTRSLESNAEIALRYALGKYFDDVKQYDSAFEEYRRANELSKRVGAGYNRIGLAQRIDEIVATFDADFIRTCHQTASESRVPIFIVGMPRSGTSLAEQILASHPAVFGAGEVSFWNGAYDRYRAAQEKGTAGPAFLHELASDYLRQLASLGGGRDRVVDKMPANFMYGGLIHAAFPAARIIHMQRHPLDTCLSIYFQNFFNIGAYANDLEDLAHYYSQYVRVTDHWRNLLPKNAWLDVSYEQLTADPEQGTRRILDFLDLPWDPRCLEFHTTDRVVITASRWQVRQQIHTSSAGRWRNYEKHLSPLRHLVPH